MIESITAEAITSSLQGNTRQYLAGDLKLPQNLAYIFDPKVAVGITRYTEYTVEEPHIHSNTDEYTIVLEGETKYIDLTTRHEHYFKKGDFYIIRNNTLSAQKSLPGTVLLAVKVPGGNDKTVIIAEDCVRLWFEAWDNAL